MMQPPTAPSRSAATSLVSTSSARRAKDGIGARGDGVRSTAPRIARLWEAIRRTRLELEARERRDDWIAARFERSIRPREQAFTGAVCRLTERLVAHHERTVLGADERSLLGLWIDENLESLATHPFAPRETADELERRWRRHLLAGAHPLDGSLARLRARDPDDASAGDADAGDDPGWTPRGRDDAENDRNGARAGARARARDGRGDGPGSDRGDTEDGVDTTAPEDVGRVAPERIVSRLFRRLARALHPDREPDEARRREKHELMSDCLRARDERDVDTLLSLYVTHVGALPDDLVADDPVELVRVLRRQLDTLQGRLRRHVAGGGRLDGRLGAMIVERYAATERARSERLFAVHARALDEEIDRVATLEERVGDVDGLREALVVRRTRALDRLAIDELTGVTSG